jgi:PAS domain S-box-containing protein
MSEGYAHCRMFFDGGLPSDFIYLDVNKAFGLLTGLSDVVGKRVSAVIPGLQASNPELFQAYGRVSVSGRPEKLETYVESLKIWFSISVYSPSKGDFVAVFENITPRKLSEEALRRSENRLRQLLEDGSDLIAIVDEKGIVRYQSPSIVRLFGYRIDELVDHDIREFIDPEDHAKASGFIERTLAGAAETSSVEVRFRHRDGTWRVLHVLGRRIHDACGARQLVVNSRDVTESRQLEQKFLRTQRLEAIGALASGVAHDLNNILAPMLMATGLLREKLPSAEDRAILALIEGGAQRGASVIKQLLTFGRGIEGARVNVQVRHLLRETVQLVRETFPRNIEIKQKFAAKLWTVMADATQLHQVFMNLCVNARDAMPAGGQLVVAAENIQVGDDLRMHGPNAAPGPYVLVTFADSGTGIETGNLDRIFDPFFTTKGLGKGTGLGLSTVLGIVKSHGGFVRVKSELGRGTSFMVYLPSTGRTEADVKPDTESPIPTGNQELILVVDDEAAVVAATSDILRRYNYRVLTASGGEEAIKTFIQHSDSVALVLTDLMMPRMGGLDLVRTLRIIRPGTKIIFASGLDEKVDSKVLDGLSVMAFLSKPYAPEVLLKSVNAALVDIDL